MKAFDEINQLLAQAKRQAREKVLYMQVTLTKKPCAIVVDQIKG